MTDILCRWVNSELQLSKPVDGSSLARDFSSGYLLGKVLHKYQLQDDFDQFSKSSAANSKLNNFIRLEPTLLLLGVPFDLGVAKAVIQEREGAATRLLYQLYIVLQKKKRLGLTGVAMETLRPAATARLHRVENNIYTERMRTVVRREADLNLQRISQRFEVRGREIRDRASAAQREQEQRLQRMQEELRLQDVEKRRTGRRKQQEVMTRIQGAIVQIPKPPPDRTLKALERQRQTRKQREIQGVYKELAQFEKNLKKLSPTGCTPSSFSAMLELPHSEAPSSQRGRTLGPEDTAAREERAKRRRRFLTDQQRAHEELQDRMEEEQLVERLTRQTQQERRLAVQLMQVRQQKDVIRQNRVFRERQYQEQRQRDFEEALDREAALARQAQWDHAEEIRREREQHDQIAAERAQERYRKHFLFCREVLEQVVDLATKAGEYRLLTGNLIPGKMVREWKELLFTGKPLYDGAQVEAVPDPPTPEQLVEMEKLEILNCQDYDEYSGMMGEWAWPEEQEAKQPPSNNNILGHVVNRLRGVVDLPPPELPPPSFPTFTLKACVLGKVYSGKTTCLARIAQVHGVQVLSVSTLVQEAVQAFQAIQGAAEHAGNAEDAGNENKMAESPGSSSNITDRVENGLDKGDELSVSRESGPVSQVPELKVPMNEDITSRLSVKAQYGAVVEKILRKGQALPDELQVDIVVEGVRQVPAGSGWVLDGFPSNLAQAKLLEKALRGSDPDPPDRRRGRRRASLAVNPNPPREAPPPLPALDLVLLLDLSDSAALDRAGKQADELETHPPSEGDPPVDPGAQDSAPPPPDKSLEKRQIQHRITAFQDTWPKLERWFSRKQGVLVQVNGEVEEDALYRKVESAMFQAMARKAETGEDAEDHGEKIVRSTPVASTALSPVPASPSAAPAKSTPATAQEPPGRRRSRSKSSSRSPKGSRSRVGSGKDGKGKKPETPDGKSQRKRSKSGSARSGGSQGRSRGVSMSSPLEAPQGESAAPPEDLGPPPGSEDWVYVDEPLPKEISEYLVPYWENACSSYESSVKTVMQNLRGERNLIIRHLYNIREDFKQYLKRPDEKQELVSRWQQDYNAVPEDMRSDERTKAELHQRLDDLRERLWDVADGRREDAERERTGVMGDGWLDDHSGVLVNHFCSLMQVEVDRFQDSVYVLRDYYRGMCGRGLPEPRAEFVRIPLLDLTNGMEGTQPDGNKSPPGSAHSERKTSSSPEKKDSDGEEKKSRIVPLIPRRPPSAEALTSGGDPAEPSRDERLLCDIWQTALTAVSNMVSAEQQQREEEEENEEQLVQRPRVKRMSVVSARASSAKDKKKAGKKKSGATPVPDPTPPPPAEEDTALLQRKALRAKIRQEYGAALDHEARAAVVRLELIKARALSVVRSLQRRAAQAYGEMEEWNGARFLAEMTSIDQLAEVGRQHIERAAEIEQELVLRGTEFFLNGDVRVVPVPVPAPRPPSVERPPGSRLSVLQLEALHAQLLKVAPEGVLSPQQLAESLQQLISTSFGSDSLPEPWLKLSEAQVLELVSTATQGSEVLDWRLFLLGVALPWPIPTQRQLLQTLARFKAVDTADTGFISEEQYLQGQMDLWFPRETSLPIPDHPSEPLPYDRLSNLRKFFFALFADGEPPPARLDYVNMLLYFASHPDPQQGFVRALSIVTGRALQYRPRSAPLLKSVPYMEECESSELGGEPAATAEGGAEGGEGEEGGGVSIPDLLKVICHGGTRSVSYNRFHPDGRNREEYEEDFAKVFRDLGFSAEEKAPFGILSQHPLFQELMDSAPQYQLTDLHQLLQAHLSEGKSAES
ncbi:sperm flagellar protein 2 isoform X3 [Anguilla anguilla]|uniref:sperm flagellar protein 2 isoform X3 n=1 Tax=Anguilla anguilla TaxID=7936 RepID=UPI0015AB0BB7|nr:sperm flagellar protein 2 isoform X3 [Anguilla anguilla]